VFDVFLSQQISYRTFLADRAYGFALELETPNSKLDSTKFESCLKRSRSSRNDDDDDDEMQSCVSGKARKGGVQRTPWCSAGGPQSCVSEAPPPQGQRRRRRRVQRLHACQLNVTSRQRVVSRSLLGNRTDRSRTEDRRRTVVRQSRRRLGVVDRRVMLLSVALNEARTSVVWKHYFKQSECMLMHIVHY